MMKTSAAAVLRLALAMRVVLSIASGAPAFAGTTWDGGGANTNINTAANWDGDTAPDLASGTSTLSFATGGALATLNISADVRRILFNSQVPFAIAPGGGTLTLRGENVSGLTTGLTALPWSPFGGVGYSITAPLTLSGSQAWNVVNGTGPTSVVVSSGIAGTGGLSKWGSGTLVLTGSSSYSGGGTVTQNGRGTLILTNTTNSIAASRRSRTSRSMPMRATWECGCSSTTPAMARSTRR